MAFKARLKPHPFKANSRSSGKRIHPNGRMGNLMAMRDRRGLIGFIAVIQSVLFFAHWLLYQTWAYSLSGRVPGALEIKVVLAGLSVSFVAASVLAFRYTNPVLRVFYRAAAVWLGLLTFLFFAAVASWIVFGVAQLAGFGLNFHRM